MLEREKVAAAAAVALAALAYTAAPKYMSTRLSALSSHLMSAEPSEVRKRKRKRSPQTGWLRAAVQAAAGEGDEELSVFMLVGQSNMAGRGGA
jgi:hypothetical protein